jgi:hypothetical protein
LFGEDPASKALIWVFYGGILIFTVYVVPNGVAGLTRKLIGRFAR